MIDHETRSPTHICMDCGALGYAGGYHDHGGGNAGDTASFADLLALAQRAGEALDALDRLREAFVDLLDEARDMRSYVPDYFAVKWHHDEALERAAAALKEVSS